MPHACGRQSDGESKTKTERQRDRETKRQIGRDTARASKRTPARDGRAISPEIAHPRIPNLLSLHIFPFHDLAHSCVRAYPHTTHTHTKTHSFSHAHVRARPSLSHPPPLVVLHVRTSSSAVFDEFAFFPSATHVVVVADCEAFHLKWLSCRWDSAT